MEHALYNQILSSLIVLLPGEQAVVLFLLPLVFFLLEQLLLIRLQR